MNKDTQIEDIFGSAFSSEELVPPASLMNGVFGRLDELKVENMYNSAFAQEEIVPSPGVWSRISRTLWLTSFLTFTYNRLNIYYVAGAIGAASLLLLPRFGVIESETEMQSALALSGSNNTNVGNITTSTQTSATAGICVENADTKSTVQAQISAPSPQSATTPTQNLPPNSTAISEKSIDKAKDCLVEGNKYVCLGTKQFYSLNPAQSKSYIDVDNSVATILADGGVLFHQEGTHTLAFRNIMDGEILSCMNVTVSRPLAAEILGDSLLCQDGANQTFRVDNSKDIGIQYNWDLTNNSHRIIGNGYISILASVEGTDTLRLTQIDRNTGCVSYRKRAIRVLAKPSAVFVPEGRGNLMVELVTRQHAGLQSRWFVNDEPVSPTGNILHFKSVGTYYISHAVVDKNGCADTASARVDIEAYSLYVPNAFAPGAGNDEFRPTGNGISEYRVEIFNAENQKMWESVSLVNGQPSQAWDGYYMGELQKPGMYYFTISARFENGDEWKGIERAGVFSKRGAFYLLQK